MNTNNELCNCLNDVFKKSSLDYIAEEQGDNVVITDGTCELSTVAIPLKEERLVGKENAESYITIQLYSDGKFFEPVKVKSQDLLSGQTLISKYGIKHFATHHKIEWTMTEAVIRATSQHIIQDEIFSTGGWLDDNKSFLYGTYRVTANSVTQVKSTIVQQPTALSELDCSFVANLLQDISKDPFYGYILHMHFLLSLLKERFYTTIRFCPSYALVIIGKTGTGKTSSATPETNPISLQSCCFEDSVAAIRRTFQANNNGCTIVDDFKCNSRKNLEKFEEIVRLSGDITSNGKRVSGQKVENTVVTGMAVLTGEEIPHLQASSFPRLFIIEVKPEMINFNSITLLNENIGKYNAFAVEFIKHIMTIDNFDSRFVNKVRAYRDEFRMNQAAQGIHARYFDTYAWIAIIWDYFCEFCSQHECIIEYDFKTELQSRLIKQANRFDTDPVKMFARAFFILEESNSFAVTDFSGFKSGSDFDVMDKSDEYFICSGKVYKKIVSYFKAEGISFPCSERKLRQELLSADILIRQPTGMTTEIKTTANKSISGYYIDKHKLKKIGGNNYDAI